MWGKGGCVGGRELALFLLLQSSITAMKDSHPSFYSTKTLYHLYVSDPFWQCTENVDFFIKISLEYTEKYIDQTF